MKQKRLKTTIRWVIAIACVVYIILVFWRQREQVKLVFTLSPTLVLLILFLKLVFFFLYSHRYRLVIEKCSGSRLPYWPWFRIFILGRFLNVFIPQLGNVYRSIRLKKDHQVTYTRYISAYLSYAWMDTCLNIVTAAIIVVSTEPDLQISGINAAFLLMGLAVIIALAPVLVQKGARLLEAKIQRTFWIHRKLSEVLEVTLTNLHDRRYVLKVTVFGLLTFAQMCLTFYLCFRCFNVYPTLPAMALFYALFKISNYLNITPGNIGVRELAYGILGELIHLGMTEGILVSAISRLFSYVTLFSLASMMGGLNLLRHTDEYQNHETKPEVG